jgi:hypothetical protein
MADQLPDPLVPADVDLRGYEYMPLDVVRLMRSSSWRKARSQPELGYWMVNLWVSSWHEVPAASLPDDADELADFARCEPKTWAKAKAKVLAGWIKCSDGRLYHPVVAEKALESWAKMSLQRKRTQAAREALKQKMSQRAVEPVTEAATPIVAAPVTETETASNQREVKVREENVREEPLPAEASPVVAASVPIEPPKAAAAVASDFPAMPAALDRRCDAALALWQTAAKIEGWPEVMFLNGERRRNLQAILEICGGPEGFAAALDTAKDAEFLHDSEGRIHGWFDFDWLLKPEKFTRLMEGRYAERHRTDKPDERSTTAALAGIAEAGTR